LKREVRGLTGRVLGVLGVLMGWMNWRVGNFGEGYLG
jgi:hypothetical protein